jgi:hypothetical protein
MEHTHEGTVAHHTVLQNDLDKYAPEASGKMVVRKIPVLGKYRKQPAVDGSEKEPNTYQGNYHKNRLRRAAHEEGSACYKRDECSDPGNVLA